METFIIDDTTNLNNLFFKAKHAQKIIIKSKKPELDFKLSNLEALKEVEIMAPYVTTIPYSFLAHCTFLQKVILPEQIEKIEPIAFLACNNLSEINLENVSRIYLSAFAYCAFKTLNFNKITLIDEGAFIGCINLEEVNIFTNTPFTLDKSSFRGCPSLKDINILSKNLVGFEALNEYENKINVIALEKLVNSLTDKKTFKEINNILKSVSSKEYR